MTVCQFRLLSHHFDLRFTKVFFSFMVEMDFHGERSGKKGKFCRRPLAAWLTVFTKETSAVDSRGHRSLYGVFLQTVEANGDSDCPCSQEKVSHAVFNKRGGWQGCPFCLNRPSAVISIPISVLPCLAHDKRLLKPVFTWRNTWMFWSYKCINIDKPTH